MSQPQPFVHYPGYTRKDNFTHIQPEPQREETDDNEPPAKETAPQGFEVGLSYIEIVKRVEAGIKEKQPAVNSTPVYAGADAFPCYELDAITERFILLNMAVEFEQKKLTAFQNDVKQAHAFSQYSSHVPPSKHAFRAIKAAETRLAMLKREIAKLETQLPKHSH